MLRFLCSIYVRYAVQYLFISPNPINIFFRTSYHVLTIVIPTHDTTTCIRKISDSEFNVVACCDLDKRKRRTIYHKQQLLLFMHALFNVCMSVCVKIPSLDRCFIIPPMTPLLPCHFPRLPPPPTPSPATHLYSEYSIS